MNKFKAGDRVKILPTENVKSFWSHKDAIGKIRTITEKDVTCLENCGSYHLNSNEFSINFNPSDLELVQDSLKAGDKIIMMESCPGSESKEEITTLVETPSGLLRTEKYCMHDEHWEKVETKNRKEEIMKVGDRVELFKKDSCSSMEVGSIGTVKDKFGSDIFLIVFDGTEQIISIKNLRKIESMKFIVVDENDKANVFSTKESAQAKVQELVDDGDQVANCIEVYQVAKEFEVKKSGVRLVEVE